MFKQAFWNKWKHSGTSKSGRTRLYTIYLFVKLKLYAELILEKLLTIEIKCHSLFIDHHHLQSSIFTTRTLRWAATSSVKSISEITLFSPLCNSRSYVLTVPVSFKVLKYFSCDKISLSLLTCFESFQTGDKLVNVFFRKFWLAQQ